MKADLRVIEAEPPSADAIERLEEALVSAKEGRVSSVAIAIVYRDGSMGRAWSACPSLSCLIGAVTRLQHGLLEEAE
jgi:hypothetical protein